MFLLVEDQIYHSVFHDVSTYFVLITPQLRHSVDDGGDTHFYIPTHHTAQSTFSAHQKRHCNSTSSFLHTAQITNLLLVRN